MPVTLKDDRVWFDETHKLDQLWQDVAVFQANGTNVLLLSHFEGTLARLGALLREKEIHHEPFSSLNPSELCREFAGRIWLGAAAAFRVGALTVSPEARPGVNNALEIVVAEHHPFQSRDQQIVDAAANLSCRAQLGFYFSLDDPVMEYFGAETVKALFVRLGIAKSECLSHPLINNAVRNAQEKIESKVGRDVPTYSAADWFKYNLAGKK
jgi:preprotein translocase subunit SecA